LFDFTKEQARGLFWRRGRTLAHFSKKKGPKPEIPGFSLRFPVGGFEKQFEFRIWPPSDVMTKK
jgi:hypothetical protein